MINWQGMLGGVLVGAAGAGVLAWQIRGGLERSACQTRIESVMKESAALIDKKDAEIGKLQIEATFAKGEVAKVNAQILMQFEEQKALLTADQAARDAAVLRSEQRAAAAARESRETAARFQAALEAIKSDPDECARAPLSPDVERMLDDLLEKPAP